MLPLTSAFVNTVWNEKKKKKKKNGGGRMHVTSKYIYVVVHRTWGVLWSLPSGIKIVINLGRLVGCRMLDLPHFKDSLKALLNDAALQCLNEISYLSTKHHPKIAFVFACNITKEQHMLYLVTCSLVRSTTTMPLVILYEQLVCFSDDGSCCNLSVSKASDRSNSRSITQWRLSIATRMSLWTRTRAVSQLWKGL